MTYSQRLLFFSFLFVGLYSSCYKDHSGLSDVDGSIARVEENFTASIYGRVIDENSQPISNAYVTLHSGMEEAETITNVNGTFDFKSIQNQGPSAYITVRSEGKFDGFRRFGLIKERRNYTEVMLSEKSIIGSISASQGGKLSNGNGAEIELPANGIISSSGNVYDGLVSVAMQWIDPTSQNLASEMIGDLSGIDEDGNEKALATFGMLQVELLDDVGNELNLSADASATLQFPVPSALQANAPATIPLWSYDEEQGTWVEEGSAIYQNGVYRGEVSHFSSWNVDAKVNPIEVKGQVKLNAAQKSADLGYLAIFIESDFAKTGGWLCDDGAFRFFNFPGGVPFKILIYNECGSLIYEKEYGPSESDIDLGCIEVNNSNSEELVVISGNALNCEGEVVENGRLQVYTSGISQFYNMDADGSFEIAIDICKLGAAQISLFDQGGLTKAVFEVDASKPNWEFKDAQLCISFDHYISVSIDGSAPVLASSNFASRRFANANSTAVMDFTVDIGDPTSIFNQPSNIYLKFSTEITEVPIEVPVFSISVSSNGELHYLKDEGDVVFTVIAFEDVSGGYIEGFFSGSLARSIFIDPLSSNFISGIPVYGEFRLPLD